MSRFRIASLAVAALILTAGGAAAAPAFADDAQASIPIVQTTTGGYQLSVDVAGTSVTIDYTLDAVGNVLTASTAAAGFTATAAGHEITLTSTNGTVVSVELGDSGTVVREVETETPEATHSPEPTETPEAAHSPEPTEVSSGDSSSTDSSTADSHDSQGPSGSND